MAKAAIETKRIKIRRSQLPLAAMQVPVKHQEEAIEMNLANLGLKRNTKSKKSINWLTGI
jgi:hypothetical protein